MISPFFSKRLRELRKSQNLTLAQLGDAVDMKKNSLSNIENEKEPISFDAAIRIAEYFHVSMDYLLGWSDNPNRL